MKDMNPSDIVYGRETYASLVEEIKPLLHRHWEELALNREEIPLDPEYDFYEAADKLGLIRLYAVRKAWTLIGYAIFMVRNRHHHYAHRWAVNDILWIAPEHRNAGVGNGLFDVFEADLKADGPIVIHVETKQQHPELAMLCLSRGYGPVGPSYSKRLV